MPKYLLKASYQTEGVKGLLKDGGTKRRESASKAIEGLGGKVEAFYYAFGDDDAFVIFDSPDNATTTAVCLAVAATGMVACSTTVLMTPEEVDDACAKTVSYSPPGG